MSNDKESTTKIESVGFLCEDILSFLSGHNNISNVAKFWNGFEGWMKFEIVTHLMNEYKFEPWEGDKYGAIGVEYKAGVQAKRVRPMEKNSIAKESIFG